MNEKIILTVRKELRQTKKEVTVKKEKLADEHCEATLPIVK